MWIEEIDEGHPNANMYRCRPCPKCKSKYRWPDQKGILRCDDCGYEAVWKRVYEQETGKEQWEKKHG